MRKGFFLIPFLFVGVASAAFPTSITYQGSLKQNGSPVTGSYSMEFKITNVDGSQVYWASGVQSVAVKEGLYKVDLTSTSVDWANVDPYIEVSLNGTKMLPREKITSGVYANVAKKLAPGDVTVTGRFGVGTSTPSVGIHLKDGNQAANQDEIIYSAEGSSELPEARFQLQMGFRTNTPSLQSYRNTVGPQTLLLNPDGGGVSIGMRNYPYGKLTIFDATGEGTPGNTNTLFGAGYSTRVFNGNRQFWIQQWFCPGEARMYLVGNGYVSGTTTPVPYHGPYTFFSALEYNDAYFGFVVKSTSAAVIDPAVVVTPWNGNVGIKTTQPTEALQVNGNIKVNGKINSESDKPAFFVTVSADDCGWSHPYQGCPSGYAETGRWHVGGGCDGSSRGTGYENGSISAGWMALCTAQ